MGGGGDVFQLVVGLLPLGELVVVCQGHGLVKAVVVGAVVVDVQLAETVDERQVAVAVESAHVLGAERDEVHVVDVAQRCGGVAVDGGGVSKELVAALGDVAAGEDGVVDGDATGVELAPS